MATKKQQAAAEEETQSTALAVSGDISGLPADIASELEGIDDLGYSQDTADRLIPILGILQDNSGEVKKNHSKRIEGAEPGMMIIRALQKLYQADSEDQGIVFQPCAFDHMWVEWEGEPGEGAPIAQYPYTDNPSCYGARQVRDPQDETRTIWVGERGTRFVDTRYHYGHIVSDDGVFAVVIPMAGTNHTISRQWTALMDNKRIPTPQGPRKSPAWFSLYRVYTRFTERGSQSWYKYEIKELGWCTDAGLRETGRQLNAAIKDSEMVVDLEAERASSDVPPHDPDTGEVIEDDDGIPV